MLLLIINYEHHVPTGQRDWRRFHIVRHGSPKWWRLGASMVRHVADSVSLLEPWPTDLPNGLSFLPVAMFSGSVMCYRIEALWRMEFYVFSLSTVLICFSHCVLSLILYFLLLFYILWSIHKPGIMIHSSNSSNLKAEAGRVEWVTLWVPGQPGLYTYWEPS